MVSSLSFLIKKIIIWSIRIYQISISPILGNRCRFTITCSEYGIKSIHKFGILKGIWIMCIRILRCHPITLNNNKNYNFFSYFSIKDITKMDSQRNFFIILFLGISYILWQTWQIENYQDIDSKPVHIQNKTTLASLYEDALITNINNEDNKIIVNTDVLSLKINIHGGNIEEAYLIKYLNNLNTNDPFHLLNSSKEFIYQENSTLINEKYFDNRTLNNTKLLFTTESNQKTYTLPKHQDKLKLTLIHYFDNGIKYTKNYIFTRNSYSICVNHSIHNMSTHSINVKLFGNLLQSMHIPKSHDNNNEENNFPLYSYRGAAYSTDKKKYQKYSFKDIKNANLNAHTFGGWIAMLQKYFTAAWIPLTPGQHQFFTTYDNNNNTASIGFTSDLISIPTEKEITFESILWIGPKIQKEMQKVAPNLNLVIDYGWLWFISQPLFELLRFIYNYVGNWGFSIIIITLIIRLIMYPLTKAQYTSMAKIRMLQPKLALLQEEYKYDKYKYHQKTIALYKAEKANPLGGCLPVLIQMPIFLALYYMLSNSVELRHAKFACWIHDLSAQDPYYILPILMGITMFFIQKMSPNTIADPIQKKIMTIMLIIFTIFFFWFPSGLVLYYVISNIITIVQQQIIYYGLENKKTT